MRHAAYICGSSSPSWRSCSAKNDCLRPPSASRSPCNGGVSVGLAFAATLRRQTARLLRSSPPRHRQRHWVQPWRGPRGEQPRRPAREARETEARRRFRRLRHAPARVRAQPAASACPQGVRCAAESVLTATRHGSVSKTHRRTSGGSASSSPAPPAASSSSSSARRLREFFGIASDGRRRVLRRARDVSCPF